MTYNEFVSAIVTMLNIGDATGVAAFNSVIARAINYAELRLQREFDFLATRSVNQDNMTLGGARLVAIPANFITIEGVNLITPSRYKPWMNGAARIPLQRATRQFVDLIWPYEKEVRTPTTGNDNYFAVFSMQQENTETAPAPGSADQQSALPSAIIIAPTPDDEYVVEQSGTTRMTPLSADNTETFISNYMEDIFLAAALKWGFAYQRDFGSVNNDPRAAQSWEEEYQSLKRGLNIETLRQKAIIGGYSALGPELTPVPRQAVAPSSAQPQA